MLPVILTQCLVLAAPACVKWEGGCKVGLGPHQHWLSLTLTGWEFPNSRHGVKFWEAKNQTEHEYPLTSLW